MIIHCPKCGYNRKPTDETPLTECPACGVIFEKYFAAKRLSDQTQETQKVVPSARNEQKRTPSVVPTESTELSSCPVCGGKVVYGAKTCPHCGKKKPAPRLPTQVTRKHLIIAAAVLVVMFFGLANERRCCTIPEQGETPLSPNKFTPQPPYKVGPAC